MGWLRRLWARWFGKAQAALPAASGDPLERWYKDFDKWLGDVEAVYAKFPDHTPLEGVQMTDAEGELMDAIANLYAEDACAVLEQLVLKSESLRRQLKRRSVNATR